MIGIIQPTRGLIFAEAQSALEKNLAKYDHKIYRSWDLTIPECVNVLIDQALLDGCNYLLFSEEDTVMPDGGLDRMIMADSDIACIDYGVAGYSCITKDKQTGELLWCGLGCTLVKAEVFAMLQKPYFRADKQLLLNNYPKEEWINAPKGAYGGHDIWFGVQARKVGFTIKQVEGECKHLKLDALGTAEVNKGLHQISQKPVISKYQTLPL